jgi:tetratricopeptide (TPR) repeat protein
MCTLKNLSVFAVAACLCAAGCQSANDGGVVADDTQTALATADAVNVADATEVDLVEEMARARQNYRQYLQALITYYNDKGFRHKAIWAERELADLKMVKTYRYLVDAEIPGSNLVPRDSIPEADALFEDGLHYMKEGGHGVPIFYATGPLKRALEKFNTIIREYPTSDKIDDAAFYAGEIYKEYFNDNLRAVQYYERAWEWNPEIQLPARFQAAVVYDYRLHDRDRALELYQAVLEHEQFNKSNLRFSTRRIKQLTDNPDTPAPEEPAGFADTTEEPYSEPADYSEEVPPETGETQGTPTEME